MMSYINRYDSLFQFYAEQHSIDWKDLKAQGLAESVLDPMARSLAGAVGLMQFMAPTFDEWSNRLHIMNANPYNPEHSIQCGAGYLRWLIDRYQGDLHRAYAAYNWGLGHVDHAKPEEYPDETKKYLARILALRSTMG
jgi:soluble lytic murein transglycosylase-like protein